MNNFFNRNTTAKIMSILFALIMWTYVMGEINPVMSREFTNVQVQILNIEELKQQGLVIVGEVNDNIRVTVRGRRDEVFKLSKSDIRATADLRGFVVGDNNVPVEVASINNIEIDYFPKFLRVELEEVIRRQKDVSLLVEGKPRSGYILSEPQYKPTVVWIEGPASLVNTVDRVIARLELNEEAEDIVVSLPLKAIDNKGNEVFNVDVKSPYIDVYLPVERMRTIKIQPQINATAAEGYQITDITLLPDQVTLRGPQEIINNITIVETEDIVLENLTTTQQREVELKLPEGVSVFSEDPIEFRVNVEALEEKVVSIPKERITFTEVPEGFTPEFNEINQQETFEVKITAISSIINRIEDGEIQLVADLSNINSANGGNREVELKVTIPRIPDEEIEEIIVTPRVLSFRLVENSQ
ncbi:CdaR family protein [Alkaliphilus transvaalensis]|uniref:CdaR family protein n=1 Tax=Alkaliphilus transvaalensis TaxID=114628 RepID=UPI000550701C|nr:CdaR family protein [Alkaliphilus transvaalensis]